MSEKRYWMRVIIYAARPRSDGCFSGIVDEAGL